MAKSLENIYRYLSYIIVGLIPLVVLSISTNPFEIPKLAVLLYGVGLLIILRSIIIIVEGKLDFKYSRFDLSLFLLAIAYIASTIFRSPNKMEALLLPGTTTAVVSGVLLFYLINQIKEKEKVINAIIVSATLYALIPIFAQLKVFEMMSILPEFVRSITFTTGGGYLPSAVFLGVTLPLAISNVIKQKDIKLKALYGIMGAFILFAFGLSLFQLTPGKPLSPKLPSYATSWSVVTDSVKVSPIFGVGPGNYLTAFNRFRPAAYNSTDIWAVKFSTATNFVMTSVTETGLLGLAAVVMFTVVFARTIKEDLKQRKLVGWGNVSIPLALSLLMFVLVFLLVPVTNFLIVFFFVLLAISAKTSSHVISFTLKNAEHPTKSSKLPAYFIFIPLIGLTLYVFYMAATFIQGEYIFRGAIVAVNENRAKDGYDKMVKAIKINPTVDRYHLAFAQLNLALAKSIAGNTTGENTRELTEEERNQIIQLVQQSIEQGKVSVALNPTRAGNWELLGRTYKAIVPLANGADVFSAQSLGQAILLDPNNTNLRIEIGGLYFGAKDYESAVRAFELAVATKPDHPNARFNLAFALNGAGRLDKAIEQLTTVLSLVEPDSNDHSIAKQVLEAFEKRKAETPAQQGTNLDAPEIEGEKILKPPLELGEEEAPPEGVEVDEPEVSASPSVTTTPTPTIIP